MLQLMNLVYYALYLCKVGNIQDIIKLHASIRMLYSQLLE